jgi:hypothetical protein
MTKKPTDEKSPLESLVALVSEPDRTSVLGEADIDSIVLLIIEPHYAFAYWDITQQSIEEVAKLVGPQHKLTLRFYDAAKGIPSEHSNFWDIEVFDRVGNWYIKLNEPDQLLVVDIGLKDDSGRYCTISRTHAMKLHADPLEPSSSIEQISEIPLIDMVSQSADEPLAANHDTLKKILGPHFYSLLIKGDFESIVGSTAEAVFQDLSPTNPS